MTFEHFCYLVKLSGPIIYDVDDENESIHIQLPDDSILHFNFKSSLIRGVSYVQDKISPNLVGKALLFCNKWNEERYIPKIHLDSDNDFVIEYAIIHNDPDPNDEWVIRNFILTCVAATKLAIEKIEEEFN